ncbi:RNA polymerase II subunit A C-terminal domain phosphatase [Plecturocebus cupreus]
MAAYPWPGRWAPVTGSPSGVQPGERPEPDSARSPTGTEKVLQAQECGHLHVVNPDWLWSCLERWDKVEEQLFPLRDDHTKAQRENSPAAFPDREGVPPTALFHPMPVLPKAQPGPEVRIYDSSTGKLIRTGARGPPAPPSSLPIHQEPSSFRYMAAQPRPPASEGSSRLLLWSVRGMAAVARSEGGWRLQPDSTSTSWEPSPACTLGSFVFLSSLGSQN